MLIAYYTYVPFPPVTSSLSPTGTIDKCYPRTRSGYAFEIDSAASKRVLGRLRPGRSALVVHDTVCKKDSLEITDKDR